MKNGRQRGATLLESAITVLVFFTFLFGVLEFGRAYNIYQALTNSAREGARFAVSPCSQLSTVATCPYGPNNLPTKADISNKVQTFLDTANVPASAGTSISVCVGGPTGDASCPASTTMPQPYVTLGSLKQFYTVVDVSAPYQFLFFRFGRITLRAEASMRNETN